MKLTREFSCAVSLQASLFTKTPAVIMLNREVENGLLAQRL